MKVLAIVFHQIYPSKDIVVPLDEAFDFYEQRQRDGSPALDGYGGAYVEDSNGRCFYTFMKMWYVWDFERLVHRVVRFGLGANGDGGPHNPALSPYRAEQHWVGAGEQRNLAGHLIREGHHVTGINWATRNRSVYLV